jgi:ketose-bisphosphate aldolase
MNNIHIVKSSEPSPPLGGESRNRTQSPGASFGKPQRAAGLAGLTSMTRLLTDASQGAYAVCYLESWNLESLQAVVEAAEELQSPVIAGFNGGFLMHSSRARPERLAFYAGLITALRRSSVPISFLLNETDDLAQIKEGIDLGFNAVMVENAHLRADDYRRLVKQVVAIAHAKDVSVEAQIGHLPDGAADGESRGEATDPIVARTFVAETGVDALGVSIGNVHILTRGSAVVDLGSLRRIREEVEIPLVIHGGSGFPAECAGEVIALGVAKFNFGTNLKQVYLAAVREKLADYTEPMNPHPFLGIGGPQDILVAGREAVKQKAMKLIQAYGYAGRSREASANTTR